MRPVDMDVASAGYVQAARILRVETSLGPDVLLAEKMTVNEQVNGLFEISLAVRSKKTDIRPEELVGQVVDVSLETGEATRRTWNGLVIQLSEGPLVTRGLRAYHLTIVPSHWRMTQNADQRIWLDKTAVEVAQILCQEHGLLAPKLSGLVREVRPLHYSVQMETDFAYLTRRLEEAGIFYWFEHEGGEAGEVAATHQLVLSNHEFGYQKSQDPDVRFSMGSTDRNSISSFTKTFSFIPGTRSAADWNFLTPNGVPRGVWPSQTELPGNGELNLREYPIIGGYGVSAASEGIDITAVEEQSRLRMQAAEAEHNKVEGRSNVRTLAPGFRFKPYDVSDAGNEFEEHAILSIVHTARDRSYETNEGDPEYTNQFIAIPSRVPATPHRTTPRPRMDGTQIAIVAGPQGEEIHTDEHGRVKVWFPWDRRARKDGSDSCWIRVMQNWGGPGWGTQVIPRVDMEAMVVHIDGDPDRPVIIGLVPNPRQRVPYELPANKTRSVFKTNTYQSKDVGQFNELSFEDQPENEEIYVHAQKDMNIDILNDRTKSVGHDQSEDVGNDKSISVGNDHTEAIGQNKTLSVGSSFARTVGRVSSEQVGLLKSTFVGGDQLVVVGNNKQETITKGLNYTAETIGFDVGKIFEIKAEETFRVKVGEARLEMDRSGIIVISAPQTTIAKGGGAQLTIGPGPVLYTPALVPGVSPPPPAQCLRKMAAQRVPFIKQPRS